MTQDLEYALMTLADDGLEDVFTFRQFHAIRFRYARCCERTSKREITALRSSGHIEIHTRGRGRCAATYQEKRVRK